VRKEDGRESPGQQVESVLHFALVIRISDATVMGTERREISVKGLKKPTRLFRKKTRMTKYIAGSSESLFIRRGAYRTENKGGWKVPSGRRSKDQRGYVALVSKKEISWRNGFLVVQ